MKKKTIYIIMTIGLFFAFNIFGKALTYGGCEYSQISRLKSLVSNVNISYDYYMVGNEAYFSVTLNNVVPGIYFVDSKTGKTYNYNNTIDGEITITGYKSTNGNYKFYSELSDCRDVKLSNKYYKLPAYNIYYTDSLCKENRNHSLCQKWANITYSYDEFKNYINKYNNKDKVEIQDETIENVYEKTYLDTLVSIYVNYYYYILIGIILVCVTIMIISRKKNKFNL